MEYGKMIEAFMELPIEKQTWITLSVGWFILLASAAMLEKFPPGECRNWARAMGVLGVLLVSLQTIHATMLAEELNRELMTQRVAHNVEQTEAVATQIADPVRVVAVAEEYSATVGEQRFTIAKFSDGRYGPVYRATERKNRVGAGHSEEVPGIGGRDNSGLATGGSFDAMRNGKHVKF